jgi:alkanesulfonate monooxygenase SsuD/methylene tetrahydromethanopterin reductase-like flavin-dependent oxidoreductase (luciferase family)
LLAHAGAACDGVLLEFLHKPSLGMYVDQVRTGARAGGRSDGPRLYFSTCVVTDRERLDHIRPHMTYRLVDSPAPVKAQLGITDRHVAEIREAMADGLHAAAPLIPDAWIEPFVLMGTPEECAAELRTVCERHGFAGFVLVLADLDRAGDEMGAGADVLARVAKMAS